MKKNMRVLAMALGLTVLGSVTSVYASSGDHDKNWKKNNGQWYLYDKDGRKLTGWQSINGVWYDLNENGVMQTGWQQVGGTWYYLNESGAMQTGWQQVRGTWYYLNESGAMQTGWQQVRGTWYYLNENGAMQTGWQQVGGTWYYLNESGAMQTGWIQEKDKKYFLENNGAWNPNPLTEYEGYWTTTHSNPETDVFASISVQVDPNNEHEAIVKINSNERGSRNVASVTGKVQFTNSKGILTFENDGWGNAGTVEIKLDNGSINLNVKINKKGNGEWGMVEGNHTLSYE